MKLTTVLTSAILACTALAQYNITSKPFHLRTLSHDEKYNGTYLVACHEGAAIEGLCIGSKNVNEGSTFHFNTSIYDVGFNKTLGKTGYLAFTLTGGNFQISEPMGLSYNPTSNVAIPLFLPGDEQSTAVAFDRQDRLNIQGYLDDRVVPFKPGPTTAYYRWFACETYAGYDYTTLAWVMGEGPPQNPTCCAVSVERHFIDGV